MFFKGIADAIVSLSLAGIVDVAEAESLYGCYDVSYYLGITYDHEYTVTPIDEVVFVDRASQELHTWTGPGWNVTIESNYTGSGDCNGATYYGDCVFSRNGRTRYPGKSTGGGNQVKDVCELDDAFFYRIGTIGTGPPEQMFAEILVSANASSDAGNRLAAMVLTYNAQTLHAVFTAANETLCAQIAEWSPEAVTVNGDELLDDMRTIYINQIKALALDGESPSPWPSPSPSPSPYYCASPTTSTPASMPTDTSPSVSQNFPWTLLMLTLACVR